MLIDANRALSSKQKRTSHTGISKVSNYLTYANALRGRVGKPNNTILKGCRCRECGSWDVYAAVIGEHNGNVQVTPQQRGQETSNLGDKDMGSGGQGHFGADSRVEDGGRQFQSSSGVNGAVLRTSLSSQRSLDKDCVFASPVSNKFQVLRDLKENYLCSDGELSCCDQPLYASVVPESSLEVGSPVLSSYQMNPKELSVYTRRKKDGKEVTEADCVAAPAAEVPMGPVSFANDSVAKQAGRFDNLGEGSKWVLNHILEFCEKMRLEVEGKETDLFEFLYALESTRKKTTVRVEEEEAGDEGERIRSYGG